MIPKPLKHTPQQVSEARRVSLEKMLDRTQFADEALQSVKNTFIHFPDKSMQACDVRRSHSIPRNFGSSNGCGETTCKSLHSLQPRNNSFGIGGCGKLTIAKLAINT